MAAGSQAHQLGGNVNEAQFAKTIAWLMRVQAILIAVCGLVMAALGGLAWAMAALIGGGFGLFLTAITALRVGLGLNQKPKQMVRGFYRAMLIKFLLAVIVFVVVARWFPGYFLPVLAGYSVTIMAYWLAMRKMALMPGSTTDNE